MKTFSNESQFYHENIFYFQSCLFPCGESSVNLNLSCTNVAQVPKALDTGPWGQSRKHFSSERWADLVISRNDEGYLIRTYLPCLHAVFWICLQHKSSNARQPGLKLDIRQLYKNSVVFTQRKLHMSIDVRNITSETGLNYSKLWHVKLVNKIYPG